MQHVISKGECVDISKSERNSDGNYILTDFIEGLDYCDAVSEEWIWSIVRNKDTGEIVASTHTKLARNPDYDLLWIR
jgi:hypothetical protein